MLIEANGIRINYDLSGPRDAPVVLFSHSLTTSREMWDGQMELLSQRFRVLRIDTRGHGLSDAPDGPYTFDQLGDDALAIMDMHGIDHVHWVGLSMGGMIGMHLALRHPGRLASLAICNSSSRMDAAVQELWLERIATVRSQGVSALVDLQMKRWFTDAFLERNPPALQHVQRDFLRTSQKGYIGCSEAIRRVDCTHRLGEISMPVLIIAGEFDPGTPLAASKIMHDKIAQSRLVVLPVRHLSNIEAPDLFNNALIEFLDPPIPGRPVPQVEKIR